MTAGYLLWALKGSYLAATLLSSLPVWRFVDPLPILDTFDDESAGSSDRRTPENDGEVAAEDMFATK